MNHYLISFPSSAMSHISDEDFPSVGESSRAVIRETKDAGIYVFGGGIDETTISTVLLATLSVAAQA